MDTSQYLTTSSMSFRKYNRYLNWCMHILKWDSWQSVVVHYHVLQDQRAKMQDPGVEWQLRIWAFVCGVLVTVEALEFVGKVFRIRFYWTSVGPMELWRCDKQTWSKSEFKAFSIPGNIVLRWAGLGLHVLDCLELGPHLCPTGGVHIAQ